MSGFGFSSSSLEVNNGSRWLSIGWKPPRCGRLKLNTDGASKGNPGKSGGGGLIRDPAGQWVAGFCTHFGFANSLEAEVLALREGLNLAHQLHLRDLDVETDSRQVVQLMAGDVTSDPHISSLVGDCRRLIALMGTTTLRHVYREANACADILANMGVVCGCHDVFMGVPSCVGQQWYADAIGVEYPRLKKAGHGGGYGVRGGVMRQWQWQHGHVQAVS